MKKELIISPSILSADFSDLRTAVNLCKKGGAQWIHIDVMDNHFVPNLTIGPVVLRSLRPWTDLYLDVHLMVTDPESLIPSFVEAGADGITIHIESVDDPGSVLNLIRDAGKKAGLSLRPGTPISRLKPFVRDIDLILVMSVEPGFGGQEFMEPSVARIRELDLLLKQEKVRDNVLIEVDGGINFVTGEKVVREGADVLVSGSAIFKSENPLESIQTFLMVGER